MGESNRSGVNGSKGPIPMPIMRTLRFGKCYEPGLRALQSAELLAEQNFNSGKRSEWVPVENIIGRFILDELWCHVIMYLPDLHCNTCIQSSKSW